MTGSDNASSTPSVRPFRKNIAAEGDVVIINLGKNETQLVKLRRGEVMQNKCGALKHDDVIGKPYGSRIETSRGYVHILALDPALWAVSLPHRTQIIYPPDAGLIVGNLDLLPGARVLEAGTGSGALSHAIAAAVWPSGRLATFDFHHERMLRARAEFEEHGLSGLVFAYHRDVLAEGFPASGTPENPDGCHAVMIDLPEPWAVVQSLPKCFAPSGGRVCVFSPCIEQVQRTCESLRATGFTDVTVIECILRNYDPIHTVLNVPNLGQRNATELYNGTYKYGQLPEPVEKDAVGTAEDGNGDEEKEKEKKPPRRTEKHLFPPPSNYCRPNESSKAKNNGQRYREDGFWNAMLRPKDTGHTGYLTFASIIPMEKSPTPPPPSVGGDSAPTEALPEEQGDAVAE